MSEFIQYEHHGKQVWTRRSLMGNHRSHCLCHACSKLKPGKPDNCPIAQANFELCVRHSVVTPVYECPQFQEIQSEPTVKLASGGFQMQTSSAKALILHQDRYYEHRLAFERQPQMLDWFEAQPTPIVNGEAHLLWDYLAKRCQYVCDPKTEVLAFLVKNPTGRLTLAVREGLQVKPHSWESNIWFVDHEDIHAESLNRSGDLI